ncbi:Rne/Rng family ribonuclease [Tropheryma whipplei]|uniref:Rne/Rng family ribonuclease n=1 Tax=Tropheryma whipplei TaxID=2039 RepID=UPI0004ADB9A7|nr:Rne/Rng family ribonuclease [Tropheryma whipplei]
MFGRCMVDTGSKRASGYKVVFQAPDFSARIVSQKKRSDITPLRQSKRRASRTSPAETGILRRNTQRVMLVRSSGASDVQVGILEEGILVEYYMAHAASSSLVGNIYMGRVQNVLPGMEAAFVDIGCGRNAVLYSGEAVWEGVKAQSIENTVREGSSVLVQVTKDAVANKGPRVTGQLSLAGRYLVYAPGSGGVSRRIAPSERARLQKSLKAAVEDVSSLIIRTAAVGATSEQLGNDAKMLCEAYRAIKEKSENATAPSIIYSEPDLLIRLLRDTFNNDFKELIVEGAELYERVNSYLQDVSPEMLGKVSKSSEEDLFDAYRITEQIDRSLNRKVLLPSGGSLVVDHTEAMTVIDVNTGKFVGTSSSLEQTVTDNNLEAVDEIVRQIRLRDLGGIVVIDFIDMLLQENRDLVYNRLLEALSLDRSRHKVAEITSLGLVQMTRKKLGVALEPVSELCDRCSGRGRVINPVPNKPRARKKHRLRQVNKEASDAAVRIISAMQDTAGYSDARSDTLSSRGALAPDSQVSISVGNRRRRLVTSTIDASGDPRAS